MSRCPLDPQLPPAHLKKLGAIQLNRRLRRLHHLAESPLRVAQYLGIFRRYPVDEQVGADLLDELLELHVSRVDEGDLQAVDVEVGHPWSRPAPGGAVVVGMDVSHDKLAKPFCPDVGYC